MSGEGLVLISGALESDWVWGLSVRGSRAPQTLPQLSHTEPQHRSARRGPGTPEAISALTKKGKEHPDDKATRGRPREVLSPALSISPAGSG